MRIHASNRTEDSQSSRSLRIETPAKLNLYLEILGKRQDGYHEIESLLCPISLLDEVLIQTNPNADITLSLEFLDPTASTRASTTSPLRDPVAADRRLADPAWDIPVNEENLVVRAAKEVQEQLGSRCGFNILLRKRIPAAAGLGGGSSDAAAVTVGCLALLDAWDRKLAYEICSRLGSDVPFFLGDSSGIGISWVTGRGEICEQLPCHPRLEFLVVHPPAGCPTAEVYRNFQPQAHPRSGEKIIAACKSGQAQTIGVELFNALQSAASSSSMWVGRQLEWLTRAGFQFVLMTGSGSSCFALLDSASQPAAVGQADVEQLRSLASQVGIGRVYQASAWYADSIEQQLRKLSC